MLHKPHDYPTFEKAKVMVGCNTETALKVFFDKNSLLEDAADFAYIAFFDGNGNKIDEVQVVDEQEGFDGLYFQDEF